MSYPQNVLDKYRSHSIHYILLVSSNTENLREIADPGNNNNFLANISGKKLGDVIGNKDVRLIVDSRRISEFGIEKISFITSNGDLSGATAMSSVISGEINIRISDPSGIGFINYLMYLQSVFQISIPNFNFLLAITFIGHTDKGTTEHVDTIMIPLVAITRMILSDFTHRGSYIDFSCVSTSLGIGKSIPHLSELPTAVQYRVEDGILGLAIQNFQNAVNNQFLQWYRKANFEILRNDSTIQPSQVKKTNEGIKLKGKLFEIMITIPPEWFRYKVEGIKDTTREIDFAKVRNEIKSNSNNTPGLKTDEAKENIIISTSANTTITREITNILSSAKELLKNADSEKTKQGASELFKIVTSVTSDDSRTTLHVDVIGFTIDNTNASKQKIEDSSNSNTNRNTIPDNGIVFDYVFSGKNVDIESFDIKIENVIAFLANKYHYGKSVARFITGRGQKKSDLIKQPFDDKDNITIKFDKDTLYPPVSNPFLQNNSVDLGDVDPNEGQEILKARTEYHKTLSNLHASQVESVASIRGNPNLLKAFCVQNILKHVPISNTALIDYVNNMDEKKMKDLTQWDHADPAKAPTAKGGAAIVNAQLEHRKNLIGELNATKGVTESAPSTFTQAAYAKINIFGPSDTPFSLDDQSKFATQLFYDGWYWIREIEHTFEQHKFSQTLQLTALTYYGI